jgi:hypothetical protein
MSKTQTDDLQFMKHVKQMDAQQNSNQKNTVVFMNPSAPSSAAMKALTQLCRAKKTKGQCTLFLTMREITQGNNKKANGEPQIISLQS